MIVWLRHLLGWIVSALRSRKDLVLENLTLLCGAITSSGSTPGLFDSIFMVQSSEDGPFLDQAVLRKLISLHLHSVRQPCWRVRDAGVPIERQLFPKKEILARLGLEAHSNESKGFS